MLKCDYGNLRREAERLRAAGASVLHWDVMDGHFVPNLSYGAMVIERVRPATSLIFDVHLMIAEPARYLDEYLKAGADAITIHLEAVPDPRPVLQRIRQADRVAGLAINPETPADRLRPFLDDCDLILVMTVRPGFGGQSFMPEVLPKLTALREAAGSRLLSVDGGIGTETIADAAAAGADLFVVGSAIFDADDFGAAVADLAGRALRARPAPPTWSE
jgi:ribulose-phosphate 3-epimerase